VSGHKVENGSCIYRTDKCEFSEGSFNSDDGIDSDEDISDSDEDDELDTTYALSRLLNSEVLPALDLKKRQLIRDTLVSLRKLFPAPSSIITCTGTESSGAAEGPRLTKQPPQGSQTRGSHRLSGNGKEKAEENEEGEEEEEEGEGSRKAHQSTITETNSRRLACPFFKKYPTKYQNSRGCPGPGWYSVHRLK